MLIRSASGLRGIAENDFSPEIIDKYISAFIFSQKIKKTVKEKFDILLQEEVNIL